MVPKTIRLNANLIALFKFANKQQVILDIHPVVSAYVTPEKLMELLRLIAVADNIGKCC